MSHSFSLTLIKDASVVVQAIMALLLVLSLFSWRHIVSKQILLRRTYKNVAEFENQFWSGTDLHALYTVAKQHRAASGLEPIFIAGFSEFLKSPPGHSINQAQRIEASYRAMKAAKQRELTLLDQHLIFLASVASVSPYIGLLGTVWGIMDTFRGLASTEQATLTTLAPGIAEALIATAMGLLAAIPSTAAYNHFSGRIDALAGRFDTFIDEFSNILQRQALARTDTP